MPEKFLTQESFDRFEDRLWKRFNDSDLITRELGERIAVVEATANKNELRLDNHSSDTKKTAASYGGTVGAIIGAALYTVFNLIHPGGKP